MTGHKLQNELQKTVLFYCCKRIKLLNRERTNWLQSCGSGFHSLKPLKL